MAVIQRRQGVMVSLGDQRDQRGIAGDFLACRLRRVIHEAKCHLPYSPPVPNRFIQARSAGHGLGRQDTAKVPTIPALWWYWQWNA